MTWLSHRDMRTLMGCIRDIYSDLRLDGWRCRLLPVISRAVPSNFVACSEISPQPQTVTQIEFPESISPHDIPVLNRHLHEHPILNLLYKDRMPRHPYKREIEKEMSGRYPALAASPECRAVKISDFLSDRRYRRLALYNEFCKKYDVEYQICAPLKCMWSGLKGIAFHRDRRDFSERDRLMLNLISPHICQAYGNAEAISAIERNIVASGQAREGGITGLTLREKEALYWLAQGKGNHDISVIMHIKVCTVKKHLENIYRKIGVENRASAMLMAIGAGRRKG
ncbi:MAG: hypothetical protein HZB84_01890 [Deltaproteobacteria bacterium]|nr:hypothetical protein [Deltaproteobacteria bacterium]